jgi:hypothetical protein
LLLIQAFINTPFLPTQAFFTKVPFTDRLMSDKKTNLTDFFKKETKKKTAAKTTTAAEDQAKLNAERDT